MWFSIATTAELDVVTVDIKCNLDHMLAAGETIPRHLLWFVTTADLVVVVVAVVLA